MRFLATHPSKVRFERTGRRRWRPPFYCNTLATMTQTTSIRITDSVGMRLQSCRLKSKMQTPQLRGVACWVYRPDCDLVGQAPTARVILHRCGQIPTPSIAMPSEARKYRGDPLPDPQNRDMAVPGCGELACCEQDSDPPLTPGWARDSVDRTDRSGLAGSNFVELSKESSMPVRLLRCGHSGSAGGRLAHDTSSPRYSRPDLERGPSHSGGGLAEADLWRFYVCSQ